MEKLEQTLAWRKASASGANGGGCVEVGRSPACPVVGIRDTKSRERGHLTVDAGTWRAFLADVKAGHHDPSLAERFSS